MRQAILFYSFMLIFVITAILTLLGVVSIVPIKEVHLNMLLGAFLVELAGAVIALYKKTDFFARPADNLATSIGSTLEGFDEIADEIEAVITGQEIDPNHVHRFLVRRTGNSVVAYEKMNVITAEELESLPKEERDLIRTYEDSMNNLVSEWKKLKRSGAGQLEPAAKEKMLELLRTMKEDLVGIIELLQKSGIYLDDHYMHVRDLVSRL